MKKLLLPLILSILLFNSCDYEYEITQSEVQEALSNLFPIEKENFFLTFTLIDPVVIFDKEANRIELSSTCVGKPSAILPGQFEFPLHFSTSLLYEDNSNSLYFHNIVIEDNTAETIPDEIRELIIPAITNLTNEIVAEYPIYSVKDESLTDRFAQRFLREVVVRDTSIVMTFYRE